jgi:hypothetical protein
VYGLHSSAQDRVHWFAPVNAVLNIRVPQKVGNFKDNSPARCSVIPNLVKMVHPL